MIDRLGGRIGFLHLRSVQREADGAFHETEHVGGDGSMAAVVAAVHRLSVRERRSIPMRPDHGIRCSTPEPDDQSGVFADRTHARARRTA